MICCKQVAKSIFESFECLSVTFVFILSGCWIIWIHIWKLFYHFISISSIVIFSLWKYKSANNIQIKSMIKKKVYRCNLKPKPCYVSGSILPYVFSHDFTISTTNRQHDTFCCQKVVMIAVRFFWLQSWKGLGETTTTCKRWIYFTCVWIRKCCDILSIQNAHTWRFHVIKVQCLKYKT